MTLPVGPRARGESSPLLARDLALALEAADNDRGGPNLCHEEQVGDRLQQVILIRDAVTQYESLYAWVFAAAEVICVTNVSQAHPHPLPRCLTRRARSDPTSC